jgi:hypothetical protein
VYSRGRKRGKFDLCTSITCKYDSEADNAARHRNVASGELTLYPDGLPMEKGPASVGFDDTIDLMISISETALCALE